jgi:hypothetical protein
MGTHMPLLVCDGAMDLGDAPRYECGRQKPDHIERKPSHPFCEESNADKDKKNSTPNALLFLFFYASHEPMPPLLPDKELSYPSTPSGNRLPYFRQPGITNDE